MEIHICPIKMRTVKFLDGQCAEMCKEKDCPIVEELRSLGNKKMESVNGDNK